jgi:hypothetical protein
MQRMPHKINTRNTHNSMRFTSSSSNTQDSTHSMKPRRPLLLLLLLPLDAHQAHRLHCLTHSRPANRLMQQRPLQQHTMPLPPRLSALGRLLRLLLGVVVVGRHPRDRNRAPQAGTSTDSRRRQATSSSSRSARCMRMCRGM